MRVVHQVKIELEGTCCRCGAELETNPYADDFLNQFEEESQVGRLYASDQNAVYTDAMGDEWVLCGTLLAGIVEVMSS